MLIWTVILKTDCQMYVKLFRNWIRILLNNWFPPWNVVLQDYSLIQKKENNVL